MGLGGGYPASQGNMGLEGHPAAQGNTWLGGCGEGGGGDILQHRIIWDGGLRGGGGSCSIG